MNTLFFVWGLICATSSLISAVMIMTEAQLQVAVNSPGVVELGSNITLTNTIVITGIVGLTLDGRGYTLDGNGSVRVLNINGPGTVVNIKDLTVTGGYTDTTGGGLHIEAGAAVILQSLNIYANNAPFETGGGISVTNPQSRVIMINCVVSGNMADAGGGIRVNLGARLEMDGCVVEGNTAAFDGGGVLAYVDAFLNMSNTRVALNTAAGDGGGLALYGVNAFLQGLQVSENRAASGGGLLVDSSSAIHVSASVIDSNIATRGGGCFVTGSSTSLSMLRTVTTGNRAVGGLGGGFFVAAGTLSQRECSTVNNSAVGPLFDVASTSGKCLAFGGCFYSSNFPLDYSSYDKCTFTAGADGTLEVKSFNTESFYDTLNVSGALFSGRIGPDCVQVSKGDNIVWTSDLRLVSSGFEICYATTSSGGGVAIVGGNARVVNSSFLANSATSSGGGVFVDGGAAVFEAATIEGNLGASGDAVFVNSGTFTSTPLALQGAIAGAGASTVTCGSPCGAGTYGTCDPVPGAPSCYANCRCVPCPPGRASASPAAADPGSCVACGAGSSAAGGSASCSACAPGAYAAADAADVGGGVDVVTASAAVTCNACPSGLYAVFANQVVCQLCPSGHYSGERATSCAPCTMGMFSTSGQPACTRCPSETYNGAEAQSTCVKCSAVGPGYTSGQGATKCSLCSPGFYRSSETTATCVICPAHVNCPTVSGTYLPAPMEGYWLDTTRVTAFSPQNLVALRCPRRTCKGSFPQESDCWLPENVTRCSSSRLLCTDGAGGPLCGSCSNGFVYSASQLTCISCESSWQRAAAILGVICILGLVAVLIFIQKLFLPPVVRRSWLVGVIRRGCDSGTLRVLFSNYQIVYGVSFAVEAPKPFSSMLNALSIVSFDVFTLKCVQRNFMKSVLISSSVPLGLLVVNGMWFAARTISPQATFNTRIQAAKFHMQFFVVLTYLCLPPVARIQLAALACTKIGDRFYISSDTSVDCSLPQYKLLRIFVSAFMVVYLCIPFVWLTLLRQQRQKITKVRLPGEDDPLDDPSLKPLALLFQVYRTECYYFEVGEVFRRIFFVGVIPLVGSESAWAAAAGTVMSLLSLIIYRETSPFRRWATNVLASVAQYCILLTYGTALVISAELGSRVHPLIFGLSLIVVNIIVVLIAVGFGARRHFKEDREQWQWRRTLTKTELQKIMAAMHAVDTDSSSTSSARLSDVSTALSVSLIRPSDIKLGKRIGSGSFGEVFKGSFLGQQVAVKTILEVNDQNVKDFRNEILLTASLRNPNIINFVGCCWDQGLTCLVLEWAGRGSLESLLADSSVCLTWEDPLLRLCCDVARGMAYLHGRRYQDSEGIIHRDLKTDNVLVTEFMLAKISDFGTARGKGPAGATLTLVGTPLFCAPEISRGEAYDEKADVYSFGFVLAAVSVDEPILDFVLARWRAAGRKGGVARFMLALMEGTWRPTGSGHGGEGQGGEGQPIPQAPPSVNALIARCLAHDPAARPAFDAILKELEGPVKLECDAAGYTRRPPAASRLSYLEAGTSVLPREGSTSREGREGREDGGSEEGYPEEMLTSTATRLDTSLIFGKATSNPIVNIELSKV